jgi:predicted TIM-barrel fold metal-dependent hydrolase
VERRSFLHTLLAGGGLAAGHPLLDRAAHRPAASAPRAAGIASVRAAARGPIIDVHMHAYPADAAFGDALVNPATGRATTLKNGAAHLEACIAEMKRLNIVTGVVSGGDGDRLAAAIHWHDSDPGRFIAAAGIRGSADTPLPDLGVLRTAFQSGRLRVLGEITAQYAGLTLGDRIYEPYLALAEEFDAPASVHMGVGPPGVSFDPCCRGFRVGLGNPAVLEDALNRHPTLRVNVMHGGWPYLQETIALLFVYPQVNVDLGAIDWALPRAEFHAYLAALVRAGFGRRIMFGSDQMYWPEAIGMAVEAIDAAPFLTAENRRDIFHGNAARFLRLEG